MRKGIVMLLSMLVLLAGCKKTVESETKAWERNLKNIESLSMEFPSFAGVLKEQVKIAEPVWAAAAAVTAEEEKIKKMGEANGLLNPAFVRNLERVKDLQKNIRTRLIEARGLRLDYSERFSADRAMADAEMTMRKAEDRIRGAVATVSEAEALSEIVSRDLKYAEDSLAAIIKTVRDRERAAQQKLEEQKKAATGINSGGVSGSDIQKPADITCPYCGTVNPAGSATCKSCGAPLTK